MNPNCMHFPGNARTLLHLESEKKFNLKDFTVCSALCSRLFSLLLQWKSFPVAHAFEANVGWYPLYFIVKYNNMNSLYRQTYLLMFAFYNEWYSRKVGLNKLVVNNILSHHWNSQKKASREVLKRELSKGVLQIIF